MLLPDIKPPADWMLNSRPVSVATVSCEGWMLRDDSSPPILLPPDMRDDPAYALDSCNCDTFGSWGLFDDANTDAEDEDDESNGGRPPNMSIVNPEVQPLEMIEEESIKLAMAERFRFLSIKLYRAAGAAST
jgi:hypothetical protein